MTVAANLDGRKFTHLTVIERVSGVKPVTWKCVCDCGEIRYIVSSALLRKKAPRKSCGCHTRSDDLIIEGKTFKTGMSGEVVIVAVLPKSNAVVRFEDGTEVTASYGNIRTGNVCNPNLKTTFGVGYHGVGEHRANGTKAHQYWYKMMQRAYCPKYKEAHPTYESVQVCEEWHNYQNFAEWCSNRKQYGKVGFNLDKDLISPGNKIYHPDNCSLVPQAINKLTVRKSRVRDLPQGVVLYESYYIARCRADGKNVYLGTFQCAEKAGEAYREFKKKSIIATANEHRLDLDDEVYQALLNFEVEW